MVFEGVALVGVVKGRRGFCWNLSFQNSYLYHCYLFLLQFFSKECLLCRCSKSSCFLEVHLSQV